MDRCSLGRVTSLKHASQEIYNKVNYNPISTSSSSSCLTSAPQLPIIFGRVFDRYGEYPLALITANASFSNYLCTVSGSRHYHEQRVILAYKEGVKINIPPMAELVENLD